MLFAFDQSVKYPSEANRKLMHQILSFVDGRGPFDIKLARISEQTASVLGRLSNYPRQQERREEGGRTTWR
jgi:hypothetical protein